MIKNPSYSGKTRIAEESSAGMKSTRNPHAVDNVNVAQGPRMGNNPKMEKRQDFVDAKQARQPLADTIARAYGARSPKDKIDPKLEGIHSDTRVRYGK